MHWLFISMSALNISNTHLHPRHVGAGRQTSGGVWCRGRIRRPNAFKTSLLDILGYAFEMYEVDYEKSHKGPKYTFNKKINLNLTRESTTDTTIHTRLSTPSSPLSVDSTHHGKTMVTLMLIQSRKGRKLFTMCLLPSQEVLSALAPHLRAWTSRR
ncbi:hypothetical protein F4820DRAFT_412932 [Hypoxylon rubiginosum]|uniref:Uncharacterized protein n=1 Tax=Hypoxylon rubiginosum TaxID=110542 RepID=A0ACB9Z7Z0_9PEZI|nr:hypothetical protein F4820DRAFT_412932 [Hypoxylon rubiginosum]